MPFNVMDFGNLIRSYMINNIRQNYPDLDVSENSAYDDLFIKPLTQLFAPLVELVNSMEFLMNLDNAQYMTEDDLDAIGVGNYNIERNPGSKSVGTVTLSFLKVPTTSNLIVPAGIIFSTGDDLKFQTVEQFEFTPSELLTKYNSSKLTYDIDITVEAFDIGTTYNVSANQITNVDTKFNNNLSSVTNKNAFVSGVDKESNIDYASRIKEYYISRHLNTKTGYIQHILDNFDEVEDVYVVGFGDPDMQRDLVTVLDEDDNPVEKHFGGKVDIYIKGSIFSSTSKTLIVKSGKLKLSQPYDKINISSINVFNITTPAKTPVFTASNVGGDCVIQIDNTGDQSYNSDNLNTIQVLYQYDLGSGPLSGSDTFAVGLTKIELDSPFKNIASVYETSNEENTYDNTYYELTRTRLDGIEIDDTSPYYETTQEIVYIKMINTDTLVNGTSLTISYIVNETLKNLKDDYDIDENRIVTADVLFKEAEAVFINVGIKIRIGGGQTLDDIRTNAIHNSLSSFFDSLTLGDRVDESDIIGWLYRDTSVNNFIEYIELPLESFYIPNDPTAEIIVQRDGTYITTEQTQYPALNKIKVTELT